ncbi:hypothetical protein L539_3461 [Bordetella hinzii 5132]|nr:hypothetical protein L539_3461 [Bordetella hinzii 5132]
MSIGSELWHVRDESNFVCAPSLCAIFTVMEEDKEIQFNFFC